MRKREEVAIRLSLSGDCQKKRGKKKQERRQNRNERKITPEREVRGKKKEKSCFARQPKIKQALKRPETETVAARKPDRGTTTSKSDPIEGYQRGSRKRRVQKQKKNPPKGKKPAQRPPRRSSFGE